MAIEPLERYRTIWKKIIEVFFVGKFSRAKHPVIPTVPENPAFAGILRRVGTQLISNLHKVFGAFQAHPCKLGCALHEVNVAIDETRQHKFPAGVYDFCAHAAPTLDFGIVADGNDLSAVNRYGLGPRPLRVFRVDAAVNDDDVRRFDDPPLRARNRDSTEQKRERGKNGPRWMSFHWHLVLKIRMLAAC